MPEEMRKEMTFFASTFFENIKCAWECADAKNTSLPDTFYGHFESTWDSADVKIFLARQFF